jgi:hypothetical protein
MMFGALPSTQTVAADGTFRITNVQPGLYRIVPPALADFYVKQARFERQDALNQNVDVAQRGPDPPIVDIVLSTNVGQIEGTVSDSRLQPFPGAQVVLIPERNRDSADLYKTARQRSNRAFHTKRRRARRIQVVCVGNSGEQRVFRSRFAASLSVCRKVDRSERIGKVVGEPAGDSLIWCWHFYLVDHENLDGNRLFLLQDESQPVFHYIGNLGNSVRERCGQRSSATLLGTAALAASSPEGTRNSNV